MLKKVPSFRKYLKDDVAWSCNIDPKNIHFITGFAYPENILGKSYYATKLRCPNLDKLKVLAELDKF